MAFAGASANAARSALDWAKRTAALEGTSGWADVSRQQRALAKRLASLSPVIVKELLSEEPPLGVIRWVAWAAGARAQQRRARLVIHLRRSVDTPRGGWPAESALAAALKLWREAAQAAIDNGLAEPAPDKMPAERYLAAMRAAKSNRRPRGARHAHAVTMSTPELVTMPMPTLPTVPTVLMLTPDRKRKLDDALRSLAEALGP